MIDSVADRRRPEYTGENRCWPCTVLNLAVLALGVGWLLAVRRRRLAAIASVIGVVGIVARGYLVPYTPRFAPRLVAALPIGPVPDESNALLEPDGADAPAGEELVDALLEAGVVVPDGAELYPAEGFRREWRTEMRSLRGRRLSELAAVADELTPTGVETTTHRGWNGTYVVLEHPAGSQTVLSRPIVVAEIAAARALESRLDDDRLRLAAGRPLRTLLEDCPLCDGALTTTRAACCGEVTPIGERPKEKLICPDCRVRLFTFDD